MSINFMDPGVTAEELASFEKNSFPDKELAPDGKYEMVIQSATATEIGENGKIIGKVFLTHANNAYKGVELSLFRSKEDASKNSSVTQKYLTVIGRAAGLGTDSLVKLNWAALDADADQYGRRPAAIGFGTEPLAIKGLRVIATVKTETFTKKDGSTGSKNVVTSLANVG